MGLSVYDIVIGGRKEKSCDNCIHQDACENWENKDVCDIWEDENVTSLYDEMFGKEELS